MHIQELLTRFVRWVLGQSKQLTETRISENHDYRVHGYRIMKLNRRTARAVSTWHIICYDAGYNLEIACETLQHVDGATPVVKRNKLATHVIFVVRIWYDVSIDPDTGKRRPRKEVLLQDECVLERSYRSDRRDWAPIIIDEAIKLFYRKPNTYKAAQMARIGWLHFLTGVARAYLESDTIVIFPDASELR